ncbi:fimbria/pilus outer membrane usher protein [Paraburkholderia aspalathi]|uniref:fimbria/pilus outer membrane usher protein n=1 Tax=Paraburkholderia aspalathi TaxID=1324617 RepID=UPI0038BCE9CD
MDYRRNNTPVKADMRALLSPLYVAAFLMFATAGNVWAASATAQDAPPQGMQAEGVQNHDVAFAQDVNPAEVQFNSDFLQNGNGKTADLSRYESGNPVLPGQYRADLYLNDRSLGRIDLSVKPGTDPNHGRICMTRPLLEQMSVDMSKLTAEQIQQLTAADSCATLSDLLPMSSARFDPNELRLEVSIPQAMLHRTARGYVNPELWEKGVMAGTVAYTFNGYRMDGANGPQTSSFLGLTAGFNVDGWYFRHNGSLSTQPGSGTHYNSVNTYVQRDLTGIKSRLTIGQSNTTGDVFDTLPFVGAQVASDDRMLPDSMQGYAPVVRGIAETNARVTIRQNGNVIYDTPVSPGPFVIDDLYPTGYGGNLEVTVTEADGRQHRFLVPYASVPLLLRPDTSRFSVTAGKLNQHNLGSNPMLLQGTAQHGFTNSFTGYGGFQASEHYVAALGGAAFGTKFGAFSADITGAQTNTGAGQLRGTSFRVGYSKYFDSTQSNIAVAAYRFSTDGFLDFNGAAQVRDTVSQGFDASSVWRAKSRFSVTLNQSLGDKWGQVFLTGFTQNYWNQSQKDLQFQVGYSNQWRSLSYSVTGNRVRNANGNMDNQFMLNLTMPLGKTARAPQLSMNVVNQPGSGTTTQATLSGVAGSDNQFTYGVTGTQAATAGTSGSATAQYRFPQTTVQASVGGGRGYNSGSVGVSGSIVAHPGGVTFSPYNGDTLAVVQAPAAAGAKIVGYPGLSLDGRGYGVLPYLMPYRQNEVSLDPNGIPDDVELKITSQQVAPRSGAVVMLNYPTITGQAVLIDARLGDGDRVPFGAEVMDANNDHVGMVGQGGRIYARLADNKTTLHVKWGEGADQQCQLPVSLTPAESKGKQPFVKLDAECAPTVATSAQKTDGADAPH